MDRCITDLQSLLVDNWDEIASMRDEEEGRIKINAMFLISFRGNEQAVKTTLTYGRRVSESRESIVNSDQLEMFENGDQEPSEAELIAQAPKRARKAAQEV